MKLNKKIISLFLLVILTLSATALHAGEKAKEPTKLLVFVTSGDKEVIKMVALPYAGFAKKQGWWEEIRFLTWGPSNKLFATDTELQEGLKNLKESGVELQACKWCAEEYGVADKLIELGVEVKYMGQPLTEMLKSGWKVLTF